MKNRILILVAVLFSFSASAQKDVSLTIEHILGNSAFAFNQATTNNLNNNLEFTRVDYYISKITLIHDGGMQTAIPNKYIFVQAAASNLVENLGNFSVTNVEGIKFHIGVDAPNNTSDPSLWTGTHPLAPKSPAMHWGWASGFRFAAIEGNGGALLNQNFQYHGLFDANYFEQTIMVAGVNTGTDVMVNLDADYTLALRDIEVSSGGTNHGTNTKDLKVLENFRDYVFTADFPLAVSTIEKEINLNIYPNPTSGTVHITLDNTDATVITSASILDVTGRRIKEISLSSQNGADVQFDAKGIYFIQLNSFGVNVATKRVVVQ